MPAKTTFEITKIWDMLCRQGPSERYAPLGLSFPPLPRRVPSAHVAADGYAAPKAPVGQPCLDDELFPWLTTPIWHWPEPNKWQMIHRQITMSLDKRNRDCKTSHHGTAELFTSSGQGLLIFDPLDNRDPSLLTNYQKVSRLNESQEVASKWGLGRSP